MNEFINLQKQLKSLRQELKENNDELLKVQEQIKQLEEELRLLDRMSDSQDGQDREEKKKIEATLIKKKEELKSIYSRKSDQTKNINNHLHGLADLSDPTRQIGALSDAFPFLLLPVRLETRFMNQEGKSELWVRIYPDDCHIDTKEDILSQFEIQNAKEFWKQIWQAGGNEQEEKGAWRTLVNNHSSGRAAWITQNYKPLNESAKPTKSNVNDLILVIDSPITLASSEVSFVDTYWKSIWKAQGDKGKADTAFTILKASLGEARALEIQANYQPFNISVKAPKDVPVESITITVIKIEFPSDDSVTSSKTSWVRSPKAKLLPDRFVVLCYHGTSLAKPPQFGRPVADNLATGPDPSLPEAEQIRHDGGDLLVNEDLKWMVNFDKAIEVGMGLKIPLSSTEAQNGFDKILVVGLKLSLNGSDGKEAFQNLLSNHLYSKNGLSILPQGTPTNNSEDNSSGYNRIEDPDTTFKTLFKEEDVITITSDPLKKSDGQWLAEYLNIDMDLIKKLSNANGTDQLEARAMKDALWPGTLGYFMDEMMDNVFTDADIENTRNFFREYVSGRGAIPAIRIGKQPYGILPVTAFSRLNFPDQRGNVTTVSPNYLNQLHSIISKISQDWNSLLPYVSYVGKDGDPHQLLMDVLGLNSGSVEFHQRYAESLQHLYNQLSLEYGGLIAAFLAATIAERGKFILNQLGFPIGDKQIPILQKFFLEQAIPLTGPLIDDSPLSEELKIRAYTSDGKNYIQWLAESTSDTIRTEDFGGNASPNALLYLMLRHSYMLAQSEASKQLHLNAGLISTKSAFHDKDFIHVQNNTQPESKWNYLYKTEKLITGDTTTLIADYIQRPDVLTGNPAATIYNDLIHGLKILQDKSTAKLERAFTEHIDCCNYRLDAWMSGLINYQVLSQKSLSKEKGLYMGAYGWLEDVRPKNRVLTNVSLEGELNTIFNNQPTALPIKQDSTNAGYIHAPSLNQAATAAILKNAHLVNQDQGSPSPFAINITSERVRVAEGILEGIRNGQTLSALLGYQFERGLHDKYSLGKGEVDKFIYPLRKKFPLVSNKLSDTQTTTEENKEVSVESIEARNVIDGLALIKHIQTTGNKNYPFGFATGTDLDQLPVASSTEAQAINDEVDRISSINDAIADIAMAEGVYQVVQGNFDKAAGISDVFSKGTYPNQFDVIKTPRTGITLTHRVAIQFDPAASSTSSPNSITEMSPRSKVEPSINSWLSHILPDPAKVKCWVKYRNPSLDWQEETISQKDLKLQSYDLLFLFNLDTQQSMTELDDRIIHFIRTNKSLHPDTEIQISYTQYIDPSDLTQVSFFELGALVKSLRPVILKSRHLHAGDVGLPQESKSSEIMYDYTNLRTRLDLVQNDLTTINSSLDIIKTDTSDLNEFVSKAASIFQQIGLYSIPQTGTGFMYDGVKAIYDSILSKLNIVIDRWEEKKIKYDTLIAGYNPVGSPFEMFALLKELEKTISSQLTNPTPPTLNTYKSMIEAKKVIFENVLSDLKSLLQSSKTKLSDYFTDVEATIINIGNHDVIYFDQQREKNDIEKEKLDAVNLKASILKAIDNIKADLGQRTSKYDAIKANAEAAATSSDQTDLLLQAAKKILGDDLIILPHFVLPSTKANELSNSYNNSNLLLDYLVNTVKKVSPVQEWLYGVARVRDKVFHIENLSILSESFKENLSVDLTPVQLPFKPNDRWLAMTFKDKDNVEKFGIDSDTLLYTAHFHVPFDKTQPQCGILIDEWTEVIPNQQETTGFAFHYDQPSSEPSQTMLLAVPPEFTGNWKWNDLIDAINETLEMAKKRAIEPAHVESTSYAQFLPSTMMAVTLYLITMSTNLAVNNSIYEKIDSNN